MLNYIWISLVAIGILAAVGNDIRDESANTYRNGVPVEARFEVHAEPGGLSSTWKGDLVLSGDAFNQFYGVKTTVSEVHQPATLNIGAGGEGTFFFSVVEGTPARWKEMAKAGSSRDKLTGKVESMSFADNKKSAVVRLMFEPIRFVKIKAVTQAALDYANTAVEISLGLIGIMALWLGIMKIAEEAGLIKVLTRLLTPVTKRLFPDVPSDHPAIGAMIMNIAANMLGLNNAATPMGLKAMEELNKLNPKLGTATNAMCTFLVINTSGLTLIPATAIAVRAAAGSANPGIIIGTSIFGAACATAAGLITVKILQRLPHFKKQLEADSG
ncbi:MAG TPA: nucleoside recognition domain-containing protein [Bacteroidota bacterium]|nr:nucleoside recognition domain-containing protein [Bacteroidota bacterium]